VKFTKSTAPVPGVRGVFFDALVLLHFRTWKADEGVFGDRDSDSRSAGRPLRMGLEC
jgi:hypothetical protein